MTEDEAKMKWCPFVRVVSEPGHGETAANRWTGDTVGADEDGDPHSLCLGSACMAWRRDPSIPTAGWTDAHGNSGITRWQEAPEGSGHCGLSGAPR